jgi:hypothetical protein
MTSLSRSCTAMISLKGMHLRGKEGFVFRMWGGENNSRLKEKFAAKNNTNVIQHMSECSLISLDEISRSIGLIQLLDSRERERE